MNTATLHSPIVRRAIEAINTGSLDHFMALFAPDATVEDGPSYHGVAVIREWAERENFGVHMRIDVVRELNAEGTAIEIQARSTGGYSGPGEFAFTLRGDLIQRLVIS